MQICLVLAGLLPAVAATVGNEHLQTVLTEAEYLSVLTEAHPAVLETAAAIALAEARVRDASTYQNPVAGAIHDHPNGALHETELTVSWQLPDRSRRSLIEAREGELEAVKADRLRRLGELRSQMREAFANWAFAEERYRRLAARASRVETLAQRESTRARTGEASTIEAHRLRLAATTLESRLGLAIADRDRARAIAISWNPGIPLTTRPLVPEVSALPHVSFSPGSSTAVGVAEARLAAAISSREVFDRVVRSPEVSVGWHRQRVGSESIEGPVVGMAWSLPLFDRKRAGREAADARLERARVRLELIQRSERMSRAAARDNFTDLASALEKARRELAANSDFLDGAEAAFRYGEVTLTDLLEMHRAVTEAELVTLDLHQQALTAHRELERLFQ